MVEQQMILTVALAGVATACTDIPPTQRPTLRHSDFQVTTGQQQPGIDNGDTQAIWHRILQRSTVAA
jgi:hypothetical protein